MRFSTILSVLLMMVSFSSYGWSDALLKAEKLINTHPDSALMIRRSEDPSNIRHRRTRAKHSLLHAMALDKCYIDITSDSIISPAFTFYKKFGSAEQKLKAYYYRGVVERNAGNWSEAMEYYVRAERYVEHCHDKSAVGRLYNAKMHIYRQIYDYDKVVTEGKKAAESFLSIGDTTRFINALLDISAAYKGAGQIDSMGIVLSAAEHYKNLFTTQQFSRYYYLYLDIHKGFVDTKKAVAMIEYYKSNVKDVRLINWIGVADAYLKSGFVDEAWNAIEMYKANSADPFVPATYRLSAEVLARKGDFKNAFYAYQDYVSFTDVSDTRIFESDAKFVEDRYAAKLKLLRKKNGITIIVLSSVVFILFSIIIIYSLRKRAIVLLEEKSLFENMYNQILAEQKKLSKTRREKILTKEVLSLVEERLNVLNKFIAANISESFSKEASKELKRLMDDRVYFLESTRMSFAISNHAFLKYLADCGLDNWEIGCCCLYCIGLNGSEIGDYLQRKSYYKVSGRIRSKLGLERNMNLDTYLLHKIKEFTH